MRFTIRDLLWLTVVVALGVAWWVEHAGIARRDQQWRHCLYTTLKGLENTTREIVVVITPDGDVFNVMPKTSAPTPNLPSD